MTYQQIIWAINEAAAMAAESVRDAFGNSQDLPTPQMAWEFLQQRFADGDTERPSALPEFFTNQFQHEYLRLLRGGTPEVRAY